MDQESKTENSGSSHESLRETSSTVKNFQWMFSLASKDTGNVNTKLPGRINTIYKLQVIKSI